MILIDTDILIEYFKRKELEKLIGNSISVVTLIEFLRGAKDPKAVKEIFEEAFNIVNIDNEIIIKYTEIYQALRKIGKMLPDSDLLIASTSIVKEIPLLTKNVKHFERLKAFGLKLWKSKI